jgi:hypothetical protein
MVVEKREEALFIPAKPQSAGDRYTDTALNGQRYRSTEPHNKMRPPEF